MDLRTSLDTKCAKKNLHPSDTRGLTRAVQPVAQRHNADILAINASEDFQLNAQSNMNEYKMYSEEKQGDRRS